MVRPLLRLMKGAKFIGLGLALLMSVVMLQAQTGGQGGLTGTVTDASGAVIADATVIATNQNTGIKTEAKTTSAGMYVMNPLPIGVYTVEVTKDGFKTFRQENLTIDGLKITGLNAELQLGSASEQIVVTAAPPQLEVTNSTLGGLMENKVYSELPIQMSGQQRDATAFATLLPGAQGGARAPIIGGTGNYLTELYLDGIPITTANQQGDNRVIFNSVPIEAVEQFQVLTSSIPVEYQGAGLLNFSIKSGTSKYHGSANMFFRNTIFDTWCYTCKAATKNLPSGAKVPADKPYENQNEMAFNVGGPIPYTKNKGFFHFTYDRFHGRAGVNPGTLSVPTTKMRQGDFSELIASGGLGYKLYDPTTQAECTSHSTNGACRYGFGQHYAGTGKGPNGNPTGDITNIIPASQLSPIAQYMQKFMPEPSNSNITGNYLGGVATGYDNWAYVAKIDYDITSAQRLSAFFNHGSRLNVPMSVGANPTLPLPYTNGALARIIIHTAAIEHAWTISPTLLNQFKYGFVQMGGPPVKNPTQGSTVWAATAAGITGLPTGQAAEEFPGASFGGSNAPQNWTQAGGSTATYSSTANTFTLLDNVLWTKGAHSLTFGFQYQFLQSNASTNDGPTGPLNITYSTGSTGMPAGNSYVANSGYSYASYMLGAVSATNLVVQNYSVMGGRYHPFAPYVQDDWKVTRNLTLNLGLRYDYMTPYNEVKDRWSFLNPKLTNTISGTPGMLQFAGNRGAGVSCNCRTPVDTYKKNFGPRLGLAYSINDKTVVRAGFSIAYSHGGGVGGRGGAANGTGQAGFTSTSSFAESVANGPAFYLNNSAAFTAMGLGNTNFGGPGWTAPVPPGATAVGQTANTGNYIANGAWVSPSSVGYADPYLSGRAPTFNFYNIGIQRALSNNVTLTVNYAGSQSHFLATGAATGRGYWSNQVDPSYLLTLGSLYDGPDANPGKTPLLSAPAIADNITKAQKNSPAPTPYAGFIAAAGDSKGSGSATIAQMLKAFPQYSGVTDTWGNIGNNSYNSLQISLAVQNWKGLNLNVNYTYAQNVGDDGTFRTGYAIPSGALSNSKKSYKVDEIEKSATLVSIPQTLSIYGTGKLPFGKGGLGANNRWVNVLAGGWSLSGIYKYSSGAPLAITYGGCNSPGMSQCMPDLNPNFTGKARINGSWGSGATGANPGGGQHVDYTAFQAPQTLGSASTCAPYTGSTGKNNNPNYKACINLIGNAPRTLAYGLRNPSSYNLDMSVRRTIKLTPERFKFILEADCLNVTNKHTFGGIGVAMPQASPNIDNYGQNTSASVGASFLRPTKADGNRDWQLAGHITF